MSKPKMAVRKKQRSFQFDLDLGLADKTKKLIPFMIFSLLISGLGFLVVKGNDLWNELLPVNTVSLQGQTKYLTQKDFVNFIQRQSTSGLLALDLEELQKKAKEIEWVKSVEIRKIWPETLLFIIEEHQPVATFENFLLTQQGSLVGLADTHLLEDTLISELPKISFTNKQVKVQQEYNFIWNEFKQMKLDFELVNLSLNNLHIDETNNWRLDFVNDFSVNLGRKDRLVRVERLIKVFKMIENRKEIKNIDLRYHNGFAIEWNDKTSLNHQELKQKS